jgi:ketosteroid isomerase-like protein
MSTSRLPGRRLATIAAGLLLVVVVAAAVGVHAQGGGSASTSKDDNRSLAARVQRIEDTEEIQTLLLDYGRSLDARDFSAYSHLFAKDGEWSGGMGTVQGPAAIQAFMEKNIGSSNQNHNYHLLSNFVIDVQGDRATAWSRWQFVVPGPDNKPAIAQSGRYDDMLVRENGHWKFQRRSASNDIPASGPVQTK